MHAIGKDVNDAGVAMLVTTPIVDEEVEGASRELHEEFADISSAGDEGTHHEPDATAPN